MVVPELTLYSVKAVLILDSEGKRIFAKYYTAPHDSTVIPPISATSNSSSSTNKVNTVNKSTNSSSGGVSSFNKNTSGSGASSGSDSATLSAIVKEQKAFEKGLFSKTNKQNSDIILYEDIGVVAYKQVSDVIIYVVGNTIDENEVMLYQALVCIRDAITILLHNNLDKRTILENYDLVALAIDEAIDSGIILEVDPMMITRRVSKAPANEPSINNIELSEQGLLNVYQFARGKLSEKLRQQFQ